MRKVFISYSHDSKEHAERVLAFANLLRKDGIDCIFDQYTPHPAEGWPKWMENNIESAEFVLLICTKIYLNHVTGKEDPGTGLGVKWEGKLIYNWIYESGAIGNKFIPVLFTYEDKKYIPVPLKGQTYYAVIDTKTYIDLYRRLSHQPEITMPEMGKIKTLGTKELQDFFSPTEKAEVSIETTKLPITSPELFGREEQLAMLDRAWENPHTRIISFIAPGGVGKSALVNAWLNTMEEDDYRGAAFVYGWSFYSQGVTEQTQASADTFFNDCLAWCGYRGKPPDSQVEKGKLLARLLGPKRFLLLLDGLEPLQYPPGPMVGRLKDQAMEVLLKTLSRSFAGLCVITSRCEVEELKTTGGSTTFTCDLENLDGEAGKRLLESYGTKGPEKELRDASKEFRGNALALHLLGSYLKTVYGGDIRKRDTIEKLTTDKKYGDHAKRVMESYELWFKKENKPDLAVLYLLGLFDKPAETEAIEVLKEKPPIPGLTEKLTDMTYDNWQRTLSHLRELKLISQSGPSGIDCHPLVREHFGEKLMKDNPGAWKEAHERLYEYYKHLPEKGLPDTLEEMEPLFAAVRHGCLARKHQEVLYDVYTERISRKNEAYIVHKLGALGADLSCLSYFFDIPWHTPAPGLTEQDKAVVLSWTGFALRALGRHGEAFEPMKTGLEMRINQNDWEEAAIITSNISQLFLALGDLKQALDYGKECVDYADRSVDYFWMEASRTTYADAIFQTGNVREAEGLFTEAEAMQQKRRPGYSYLYSLQGFRFCGLLLSQGKYKEVLERAKTTIEYKRTGYYSLLAIALDNLSIGKALLLEGGKVAKPDLSEAEQFLHRAVDGLRESGYQYYLPLGLFARAALYRHKQEFTLSREDLEEAREIAHYGGMKLHLADYYLEVCRNISCQLSSVSVSGDNSGKECFIIENGERTALTVDGMREKFGEFLKEAERLIEETGYHLRDWELAELKKWGESAGITGFTAKSGN